ncbi:DMT family transporter [Falsiroseomonas selenitidurans]|uniref:DMT family transporter n=1 Tax=Falsiroseomonas selenitidurans TaxID=2716335 RepID=A0ABX1E7X3_9PROT|nr:DMT family transporter [Falsiroseomonas selenitidurans]NKC33146.1 DMT family transporter [Falsiroseomonas selenitidurans]
MTPRSWLLLLALSVVWGGSFFFMAVALRGFPPFSIVLGRVALAALVLAAACRLLRLALPATRAGWLACAGMGLLNNAIPFTLIVLGQRFIPSGLAAVVNAATPVFAVLAAHALTTDEKLTPLRLAGALLGLAGVAILAGPAAFGLAGVGEALGIALCLGACLSYGLSGVWSRRVRAAGLAPLPAAAGQCIASSLMMLPLVLAFDRPWTLPVPPAEAVAALLALGLLATALAYALFYALLAAAGATNTMLVTLLVPVTALLLGHLVLGEVLALRHLAGMAVIGLGLLAIDGRLPRKAGAVFTRR